jgi:hypothetical protein
LLGYFTDLSFTIAGSDARDIAIALIFEFFSQFQPRAAD